MKCLPLLLLIILFVSGYLYLAYIRIYQRPIPQTPYKENIYSLNNLPRGQAVKYVALGDSLTVGVGSSDYQETLPFIIGQNLGKTYNVTLINLASPGATAWDVLMGQVPKVVAEKPQYVSLLIGVNDIHNLRTVNDFARDYQKIVEEVSKTSARLILINIPYLGDNMLIWPPYNFLLDFRTKQFNQVIKQVAQTNKLPYVDLYTEAHFGDNDLYSADHFHPSGKGYLFWGNIINANFNP